MSNVNAQGQKETEIIDFSQVDWNNLDIDQFNELEQKLAEQTARVKEEKAKKPRTPTGSIAVTLKGRHYTISLVMYERLKEMKSEKSKQKLIDEIIASAPPVLEI
jgi:hypothetical protein